MRFISGKEQNNTVDKDKNELSPNNNTDTYHYFGPFASLPTKKPSKILGPLLVYTNKDNTTNEVPDNIYPVVEPTVAPDENPFFHKDIPLIPTRKPEGNDEVIIKEIKKPVIKKPIKEDTDTPTNDNFPPYIGPINPDFKNPAVPSKPNNKGGKNPDKGKPNKNAGTFVTPPSTLHENYIPEYNHPGVPFQHAEDYPMPNKQKIPKQPPNTHQVHIHGKGNPEEILQIINQHPEFANYPPGSVLEIHNVPNGAQRPQFVNPNTIINQRPGRPPYVVNQDQQPSLPPGVHLEHILQEIHKNNPQSNSFIPFPTHPQQYPTQHDGQIFFTQPNGPIFNNRPLHNVTQPGIKLKFYTIYETNY